MSTSFLRCPSHRPQRTLARSVNFSGASGPGNRPARVHIEPAREDCGIRFVVAGREDQEIPAHAEFLQDEALVEERRIRATSLRRGGALACQVEHLLAALNGLGITNATVVVNPDGHIPAFDGSCREFVSGFLRAGVETQWARAMAIRPIGRIRLDGIRDEYIEILPRSGDQLTISYTLVQDAPRGLQSVEYRASHLAFVHEIASARTFESSDFPGVEATLRNVSTGLAARDSDWIVHDGRDGYVDHRLADEGARHRILDFVGDIALAGGFLEGAHVNLYRSGHVLNGRLARLLCERESAAIAEVVA